jgi:CRISPR-associated endoribonuclease Cas2 subtype I-E
MHGFLSSVAVEASTGVFVSTTLSARARDRVWAVLTDWFSPGDGSVVMVWEDTGQTTRYGVRVLGEPPRSLHDHDGVMIVKIS